MEEDRFKLIRPTLDKIYDLLEELADDAESWKRYEIQVSKQRRQAANSRWAKYRKDKEDGSI